MSTDTNSNKDSVKTEDDHIWIGLLDGITGIFTGVFNTRIGLGLFLFVLGLFLVLVRVAKDDPGGLFTIRTVGAGFLIGGALLIRSGIMEKRREREEGTKGVKSPMRKSLRRRR